MSSEYSERKVRVSGDRLDFNYQVGEPVKIEYGGARYDSVLRGAFRPKYVLVDFPFENGQPVNLDYNSKLVVRFLCSGSVCGFSSYILRIHRLPPIIVLEYPEIVDKYRLRMSKRIVVRMPVSVKVEGDGELENCAVLDISSSGMLLGSRSPGGAAMGAVLNMKLILPNGKPLESVKASVRRVETVNERLLLGVSFMEGDGLSSIRKFCGECSDYIKE